MKRRAFLALAGSGVLAGCSSINSESADPTDTPTATPTPAPAPSSNPNPEPDPTPTPETAPERPEVIEANHVYEWESFGDAIDNAVAASTPGVPVGIAGRYRVPVSDGQVDMTEQVQIYNQDGTRVASNTFSDSQLASGSTEHWEHMQLFRTGAWSTGEYTAEVIVRDNATEQVSEPYRTSFEMRPQLPRSAVSIQIVEAPSTISTGETYQPRVVFSNSGLQDGGFLSTYSARSGFSDWTTYSTPVALTIPSSGTNDYEFGATTFSETGEFELRIDRLNYTWPLTVTD